MNELRIEGMTCSHCQKSVQQALESVEGSQAVQVYLETGLARVEGPADIKDLIAAVEAGGYQASPAARQKHPTAHPGIRQSVGTDLA